MKPSNEASPLPPALLGTSSRRRVFMRRARVRLNIALTAMGPRVRRSLDVTLSAMALAALTPLFIFVAIAIKLQDRGPIVFKQERIGRGGKRFMLFKFRTMVHGADAMKSALAQMNPDAMSGVRFKLTKDPRVTKIGRILRRFSIDEMPQIYNVLRGDMTLVGPAAAGVARGGAVLTEGAATTRSDAGAHVPVADRRAQRPDVRAAGGPRPRVHRQGEGQRRSGHRGEDRSGGAVGTRGVLSARSLWGESGRADFIR
jgi:lipopolysaccharide/colanic/teichoic acid biosynthesis glycosyltransferase